MTAHVAFAHTGDAPFPCAVSACRPGARRRRCAPPGAMEPRARALLLPLLLLLGAIASGAAAEQAFVGCARLPPVPTVTFPDDGFLQCLAGDGRQLPGRRHGRQQRARAAAVQLVREPARSVADPARHRAGRSGPATHDVKAFMTCGSCQRCLNIAPPAAAGQLAPAPPGAAAGSVAVPPPPASAMLRWQRPPARRARCRSRSLCHRPHPSRITR